ncbi:MAG TPA: translation elongation factor 4 [Anaerolineae bacterium]|nr:translation elongation factor 4 [Anaerolineae bacterium]
MDEKHIRNFCIIAHVDHGKSTLADRLLEHTGTISLREMKEQVLDSMELEREKGVTIKASAVRMRYTAQDGQEYEMNLIDTPGHVDFTYEVSRALNACEGALLVVDATQGVEAQTLANMYLAIDANLTIIPVINKIDLDSARPDDAAAEIAHLLGISPVDLIRASAKEGIGIDEILEAIVAQVPEPRGNPETSLRALIFDTHYDAFKGVVAYLRVIDGSIDRTTKIKLMATNVEAEPLEIGTFSPTMKPSDRLEAGEVGYIATGLKTIRDCHVGDTITDANNPTSEPLPGYRPVKPMVYAGLYPVEADDYQVLKDALEKLQLNDASLIYEPETSQALNFGFRCGFLGLFHMEIIQERVEREYDLDILMTAPSVEYEVLLSNGNSIVVDSPAQLPDPSTIDEIREPWMNVQIFTPTEYIGTIMDLVINRRGAQKDMEYLDPQRVMITYELPLAELIIDFHDQLKSRTRGYASMDYTLVGYRAGDLVKMDILVNEIVVDALATIVHRKAAYDRGSKITSKMKELIPSQMFPVPLQAAVGGKIIARSTVKAQRKDVLAKCYGGDISRKRKLLEKQKAGKKRLKMVGSVEVPQEAFMAILKMGQD